MTTQERLLEDALKLPVADRELLAVCLLSSIERDADYERLWSDELTRRIEDIESGGVEPVNAEALISRLRLRLDEPRG